MQGTLLEMQTSVLKIHKAGAVASEEEPTADALPSDGKMKSQLPLGTASGGHGGPSQRQHSVRGG